MSRSCYVDLVLDTGQLVRECAGQHVIFVADPVVSPRAACAPSPASQVTAGGGSSFE